MLEKQKQIQRTKDGQAQARAEGKKIGRPMGSKDPSGLIRKTRGVSNNTLLPIYNPIKTEAQ